MRLPLRIANQYLFTDYFFSKRGLLTNAVLVAIALPLLALDLTWGVPVLIVHFLAFQFVAHRWLDYGIKAAIAGVMMALPQAMPLLIVGLLVWHMVLQIVQRRRLNLWLVGFTLLTTGLLFTAVWVGVLVYLLGLLLQQLFRGKRNAVHVISRISVLGIVVGTTALILVLSVFNGFQHLIEDLFDAFNADVKIVAAQGKVFTPDSAQIAQLKALPEVLAVSQTLEEVAFFEYDGRQDFGLLKGVDQQFATVSNVDSNIIRGFYALKEGETAFAVVGAGMEYKLGINVESRFDALQIYMPKRSRSMSLANAFKTRMAYPVGSFAIQQEFDDQYVITDLELTRDLLSYSDEVSALELALRPSARGRDLLPQIEQIMGKEYIVLDRYRQNEAFFKLMNIEKWIGFAVLSFTLLLVSFNMVGALWMLVLEKKKDIAILKSMGMTVRDIQRIFLYKGVLLAALGGLTGVYIALIFYFFQTQAAIIKLAGSANLLVDAYPIALHGLDFGLVFGTVLLIGALAAWLPAWRARRVSPLIREE